MVSLIVIEGQIRLEVDNGVYASPSYEEIQQCGTTLNCLVITRSQWCLSVKIDLFALNLNVSYPGKPCIAPPSCITPQQMTIYKCN